MQDLQLRKMNENIHPTALISPNAKIGDNVSIGAYSVVHSGVELGANSTVGTHCELGLDTPLATNKTLIIGDGAIIRSGSIFYTGSNFGNGLKTGHHVVVREHTSAGVGFQIGTRGDVQGHCKIGDYVKTHSCVHIGQKSSVGNFVWLFPDVILTNDPNPPSEILEGPVIGDFAVVATRVVLLPAVSIGSYSVIGAHSTVGLDVPSHMFANGSPAKVIGPANMLRMKDDPSLRAYPWSSRFQKGYPDDVTKLW